MGIQGIKSDMGVVLQHSTAITEKASGVEALNGNGAEKTNIDPQKNMKTVFEQAISVVANYKDSIMKDAGNIVNLGHRFVALDMKIDKKIKEILK